MSKDAKETAKRAEPRPDDAKETKASLAAKKSADENEELEEGLEETFPGSDAPSSTRRHSEKD